MIDIDQLLRKNILQLTPYASARDEFSGTAHYMLDANENPFETGVNRYPDPYQRKVKAKLAAIKSVEEDQIFLGNGSDEAIDLLIRIFCEPGTDDIVQIDPSYGMYEVLAEINNLKIKKVPLSKNFELDAAAVLNAVGPRTKIIFLCSPNNPSGNNLDPVAMLHVLSTFKGIVVVDEAYIDFSDQESFTKYIDQYNNLVVLQTFSKAWGLASLRLGMAFSNPAIISVLNNVKPPYNINSLTQKAAIQALDHEPQKKQWVKDIRTERSHLKSKLATSRLVEHIYPSDSNFLLVRFTHAAQVFAQLIRNNIVVRNKSKATLCDNCLRITVGRREENEALLQALNTIEKEILP